jgi:DNA-3-methyladenine glycosylase II
VVVGRWLGLADDLTAFLRIARADPAMRPIVVAAHGLHHVRFASLAEGAAYFVLTQRTPRAAAATRKRRLAADHGHRLRLDGIEYLAFPSLGALLEIPSFRRYTANPRQAEYLHDTVHGLAELGEQWLVDAPYEEADAAVRRIRGVGEFTASGILLRALGRPDHVPLHLPQFAGTVEALYGSAVMVDDVRDRYGRYIGWWSYFARTVMGWLSEEGAVA